MRPFFLLILAPIYLMEYCDYVLKVDAIMPQFGQHDSTDPKTGSLKVKLDISSDIILNLENKCKDKEKPQNRKIPVWMTRMTILSINPQDYPKKIKFTLNDPFSDENVKFSDSHETDLNTANRSFIYGMYDSLNNKKTFNNVENVKWSFRSIENISIDDFGIVMNFLPDYNEKSDNPGLSVIEFNIQHNYYNIPT